MDQRTGWQRSFKHMVPRKMMGTFVYYGMFSFMIIVFSLTMMWNSHHLAALDRARPNRDASASRDSIERVSNEQLESNQNANATIQENTDQTTKAPEDRIGGGLTSLENVTKPIRLVIVSSVPRSGSSFLGELLSSPREALYLFEPLWYFATYNHAIRKNLLDQEVDRMVPDFLHKLLECRISELPEIFDTRLEMHIWRKPLITTELKVNQRTAICNDLKMFVVKLVRPKLSSVLPLLKIPDLNVHILHLVRDPRGIVNSVSQLGDWKTDLTPNMACVMLRNDIESSLRVPDHPRVMRVRYEDVVARPEEEGRRIFNWLGLKLPAELHQVLKSHYGKNTATPAPDGTDTDNSTISTSKQVRARGKPEAATKGARRKPTNGGKTPTKITSTTSPGPNEEEAPAFSAEVLKDAYGTIRESNFTGLHWLKELDPAKRQETEDMCRDVLKFFDYPLVYPQETSEASGVNG